jgi:hypothetical protein
MRQLWVRKGPIEEEADADRQFWQQTTTRERFEAMQELQREVWGDEAMSRGVCRVARVVEIEES